MTPNFSVSLLLIDICSFLEYYHRLEYTHVTKLRVQGLWSLRLLFLTFFPFPSASMHPVILSPVTKADGQCELDKSPITPITPLITSHNTVAS